MEELVNNEIVEEVVDASVPNEYEKIQNLLNEEEVKRKKFRKNSIILGLCVIVATPVLGFSGVMLGNQYTKSQVKANVVASLVATNRSANLGISEIVEKTSKSVVEIQVKTNHFGLDEAVSSGSGVIISEDGYIVSNHHVVTSHSNSDIVVKLKDGSEYPAEIVGSDARTDLAVIKINATNLTKAEFMNSDEVVVGENAIAIGNSLGVLGGTVTKGIVSGVNRESNVGTYKMSLIQTDAPINRGNSGGGLFNESGQLIGVVTQKLSGQTVEGLGFAIPSNIVMEISKDIISNGYVKQRPTIGITVQEITKNQLFRSRLDEAGVYVSESNNEALKRYDLLKEIDGVKIETSSDILDAISDKKIGDTIKVKLIRDHETLETDVTLKEATR